MNGLGGIELDWCHCPVHELLTIKRTFWFCVLQSLWPTLKLINQKLFAMKSLF